MRQAATVFDWNEERLEEYWSFIAERYRIYRRRVIENQTPPWTFDPILQTHRFTNIYRALDKGTKFVIDRILPYDAADAVLTLFNVIVYRRFNLITTYEALLYHEELGSLDGHITQWDGAFAFQILHGRWKAGLKINSPAWIVQAIGSSGPGDGTRLQCDRLSRAWEMREELWEGLKAATTMEEAWRVLLRLPGVGEFLAAELLLDLNYSPRMLPFGTAGENAFVNPGPGCTKGVDLLLNTPIKGRMAYIDAIQELRSLQTEPLLRLGHGEIPYPLTACNIEFCLCEFRKWATVKYGLGRHKRKFAPPTPTPQA